MKAVRGIMHLNDVATLNLVVVFNTATGTISQVMAIN